MQKLSAPFPTRERLGEGLLPYVDWRMFLLFWGFKGETLRQLLVNPEAEKTLKEGQQYLEKAIKEDLLEVQTLYKIELATRKGNDIVLCSDGQLLPMLRSQSAAYRYRCLADYFDEEQPSPIGLFVVTARPKQEPTEEPERLMMHALCARLAEAGAEWLQKTLSNSPLKEENKKSPFKGDLEGLGGLARKRKMTFREKQEFQALGDEIDALEKEKSEIEAALSSGILTTQEIIDKSKRLPVVNELLDEKSMRWLELSEIE